MVLIFIESNTLSERELQFQSPQFIKRLTHTPCLTNMYAGLWKPSDRV